jgi:hypothetical protein
MLRREILFGLSGVLMMPAIVHAKSIMPVRTVGIVFVEQQQIMWDQVASTVRDYLKAQRDWTTALREEYDGILSGRLPDMARMAKEDRVFEEKRVAMDRVMDRVIANL